MSRPPGAPAARTGRRPGQVDTRARILEAARATFGEAGYEGASIRGVAARAGVDPALVHHYFGTKQRLFIAAMELPIDPLSEIPPAGTIPEGELGELIARRAFELWDSPRVQPIILGLVRSATTDDVAAQMLRAVLEAGPFLALARATNRPDATLRAILVGTQLIGMAMARYIVRAEPVASMPAADLVRAIAPTLQRYLTGDLGAGA